MENKEETLSGRTKVVKINGVKTTIVIPSRINKNEVPKEFKSEQNHPTGLALLL